MRDGAATGMQALCVWAAKASAHPLPAPVRRRAATILADDLAAMVAGSAEPQVAAAQRGLQAASGPAEATVFAQPVHRLDRASAAAANGIAVTWCELDEGYRLAPCHAGAYVLPALLAEAKRAGLATRGVLSCLAASYEVVTRLARAFPFPRMTVHPHAAFATVGAATGAALARGANAATLLGAVSGAVSMAFAGPFRHAMEGALIRNAWTSAGAWIGIRCAEWAEAGIAGLSTTPFEVFVDGTGTEYVPGALADGLGDAWAVADGYHKVYACCQYAHSAVEASLAIAARAGALPDAIVVETHERGMALDARVPATTLAAKFSMPHALAAVAVTGTGGQGAFTDATLAEPTIAALRGRVRMEPHPAIGAPPYDRPARVAWHFADGTVMTEEVQSARGGADRPIDEDTLRRKIAGLTQGFPAMARVLDELMDGRHDDAPWPALVRDMTN